MHMMTNENHRLRHQNQIEEVNTFRRNNVTTKCEIRFEKKKINDFSMGWIITKYIFDRVFR